jgi:hypothetical protein
MPTRPRNPGLLPGPKFRQGIVTYPHWMSDGTKP